MNSFLLKPWLQNRKTIAFHPTRACRLRRRALLAGLCIALKIAGAGCATASAQTNQWAWMGGSSIVTNASGYASGKAGVYGTLGLPAPLNLPGGRAGAATWTDADGHFWLFGGNGADVVADLGPSYSYSGGGLLNDLWEFDSSTQEWTWMGGSTWIGQPGVYGTIRVAEAVNIPGGRTGSATWTDKAGHLSLFGGDGLDSNGLWGMLNDLWEFDPSTGEWTWIGGSDTLTCSIVNSLTSCAGGAGEYGALGEAAGGNLPGARTPAASWMDASGNLWLFGGSGYDASNNLGDLNDLWEFSPSTNEWTWMGGSNVVYKAGVYGTLGVPAAGNVPGSRDSATSWEDASGHFWLFGGGGEDSAGNSGSLNDLWEFTPSTNEWAWMGGTNTIPSNYQVPGVYGTLGTAAAGNLPGGRGRGGSWTDSGGNLWLFGGSGYDASATTARLMTFGSSYRRRSNGLGWLEAAP